MVLMGDALLLIDASDLHGENMGRKISVESVESELTQWYQVEAPSATLTVATQ